MKPARHLKIAIDAHCHVFNARDIPAKEFLLGPIVHDAAELGISPRLLKRLAGFIAFAVNLITPSARTELEGLPLNHRVTQAALLKMNRAQKTRFVSALLKYPRFGSLKRQFDSQLDAWLWQRSFVIVDKATGPRTAPLSRASIVEVLNEADGRRESRVDHERARLRSELGSAGQRLMANPWDFVPFLFKATSPRLLNFWKLQQAYGGAHTPAIDLFCPSMLDFDYWLGDGRDNAVDQRDGILLMERIAIVTGGALLPLVAFNPRAEVDGGRKAFARVREAVEQRGFVGVKLYPPNGFLPFGNPSAHGRRAGLNKRQLSALDDALKTLYDWSRECNVPIMAHASHTIGSTDDAEECAGPLGWRAALDRFPGLRVQAGHLGGANAIALRERWPEEFGRLMGLSAGENLHADLADMSGLFTADSDLSKRFLALLKVGLPSGGSVADRLLYGSDFYMTDIHGSTKTFAKDMYSFISALGRAKRVALPGVTDKVFGLNAVRFYGLAPRAVSGVETNRSRLESFYERNHVPQPKWMQKIDKIFSKGNRDGE